PGVYFEIQGGDCDISESQFYIGSGEYLIDFPLYETTSIAPGIYAIQIVAVTDVIIATESFQIQILSNDSINPILNVQSPESIDQNIAKTSFNLELNGYDETGWLDLTVSIGQKTLYYVAYRSQHLNTSWFSFNVTNIYSNTTIDLNQLSTESPNSVSIKIRDTSFNEAEIIVPLTGDFIKPSVNFLNFKDKDTVLSRDIVLKWEVLDDSQIISQSLLLNGHIFKPNNRVLLATDRSFTFFMAIPANQKQILTFTVIAIDSFGNSGDASVSIMYDPIPVNESTSSDSFDLTDLDQALNIILIIVGVLISGIVIFAAYRAVRDSDDGLTGLKIPKVMKVLIENNPEQKILDGLLDLLTLGKVNLDIEEEFVRLISNSIENMKNANIISEVRESVFELNNILARVHFDDTLPIEMKSQFQANLGVWLSELEKELY
ncbi:MAG: hypothetical protein IH840_15120, partial [Candidatus Heimdallarchaeota archaeon]|nr:hypothetical protein [Candidatus Heimdallarchaeota archaeon]